MTCARFEMQLALYVERDLLEAEVPAVEAHLGECAECRRFLGGLRASQALVHGLAGESVGAEILAELRERVIAASMSSVASRRDWLSSSPAMWVAAAVIVVAASALVWMERATGPDVRGPRVVTGPVAPAASSARQRPTLHESTPRAMSPVSPVVDHARAGRARLPRPAAVPALSADDADQLARAVVAVADIRSAHDRPPDLDPSPGPQPAPLIRLATADPNVVIYWQLDPNGGE